MPAASAAPAPARASHPRAAPSATPADSAAPATARAPHARVAPSAMPAYSAAPATARASHPRAVLPLLPDPSDSDASVIECLSHLYTAPHLRSNVSTRCLPIRVETKSRHYTIQALQSDWEPLAGWNSAAIRWTISCALRRDLGLKTTVRLQQYIQFLSRDRRRWPIPLDWDSLEQFAEEGGFCYVDALLPGGMDPGEVLRSTILSEGSLDWDALDVSFGKVQRGESPPSPITRDYALAQGLFSHLPLGQLTPLDGLPVEVRRRGRISAARMAALIVVSRRTQPVAVPVIPAWVSNGQWVELRLNNVRADLLSLPAHSNQTYDLIQTALLHRLGDQFPSLKTPSARWTRIGRRLKLEVDVKAPGVFSTRLQLPQGQWIADLLKGDVCLVPDSYVTLTAHEGYCEVELDRDGGRLLRAVLQCLHLSEPRSRALLNASMRAAFRTECALTRITTSKFIPGSKGQKSVTRYFSPNSEEAETVVGLEAMTLLMLRRKDTMVTVHLGGVSELGAEFPVAVNILCPPCPRSALYALVTPSSLPVRLRPPHSLDNASVVLVAPLPKGWLHQCAGNSAAKRTRVEEWLESLWQHHLGANVLMLVGRSSKGDPVALYIEFPSAALANAFVTSCHGASLPDEVQAAATQLFPGQALDIFSCRVPAEALDILKERDLLALLDTGRANPCPLPAPAAGAAV